MPFFLPATFTGLDKRTSLLHPFSIHKNPPFIVLALGLIPLGSGCCLFQLDIAFLRIFVSEKSFFLIQKMQRIGISKCWTYLTLLRIGRRRLLFNLPCGIKDTNWITFRTL